MENFEWPKYGPLPLDPSAEEWQALSTEVQGFLATELGTLGQHGVLTQVPPPLPEFTGDNLSAWLTALFDSGFNTAHPGFLAFIPGGGLVTSALADWIVKTMNRYGTARFAAPRLAEFEFAVVRKFADWVGYGERAAGVLTTGGSLANFTAVVTARRAMLPEDFLSGVLYCSDQTHHSVMKAANLAGFSKRNIRIIPSDDQFCMLAPELDKQIEQDQQDGMTPFLVVGSAGTTNTGSIDPLPELVEICQRQGLWLHVDGAYGGAFVITERGRARLDGMSQADSITLDPHKGLFLPYGTGGILVKERDHLTLAHELRGEYMPDVDHATAHLDPFSVSVELSREHRGLKVALPLLLHGEQAFIDGLDEKLDLCEFLHEQLLAIPELQVLHQPELTTVAFRGRVDGDAAASEVINRRLLDEINQAGLVYLSPTILKGEFALRISILSHRTGRREIETALAELRRCINIVKN